MQHLGASCRSATIAPCFSPFPTSGPAFLPAAAPPRGAARHLAARRRPVSCASLRPAEGGGPFKKLQRLVHGRRELLATAAGVLGVAVCMTTLSGPAQAAEEAPGAARQSEGEGLERMPYKEDGYETWTWRGHRVNYVVDGEENGDPIVFVHGFGASAYHWRFNVPALAKRHRVYAIDLLGFGWSDKALVDYEPGLWRDQLSDFLEEVVKEPATIAGNSVGGYAVLNVAANRPKLVKGLILLNAAGRFSDPRAAKPALSLAEETPVVAEAPALESLPPPATGPSSEAAVGVEPLMQQIKGAVTTAARRVMIGFAFWQARQPERIWSVLQSVYVDKTNVDDDLVRSIVHPTGDANAGEVYYRLMTQIMGSSGSETVDVLLKKVKAPVLLVWGDLDPWMTPSKADRIMAVLPSASRVRLQAGHCPHDEQPVAVNNAILEWLAARS